MLSLAAAVLAAGVMCWPAEMGRSRLGKLRRRGVRTQGIAVGKNWITRRRSVLLMGLAAGLGALLAGPGGGLAAIMVTGTAAAHWQANRDRRLAATAATGFSDALGVLVAELRAGAHPGDAVRAAVDAHAEGPAEVIGALSAVAATARLGGDVPTVLRNTGPAPLRRWLARLADAWSLADRHGIPLAELLDAVRSDTDQRMRFTAEVQARLAGPRATAATLAGLPLLGLALGHAVGADPLRVLCETLVGQVLLVIGTGLACVGALWSARLMAGAVPA
jgi:tight adherence protein B